MGEAEDGRSRIVRVRCGWCRVTHRYLAGDLVFLVGNVGMIALEHKMRCEKCGKKDYMSVEFWAPTGPEWEGLMVRRLVGTKMVRKVFWRDEPARR